MTVFWVLIIVVVFSFALDYGIAHMYAYDSPPHRHTPEKFGISFEEIEIPVADGGSLYGWWMPNSPDAPTLILVHGWSRNLERMMAYIRKLYPQGYNLLAFDARNHGSSTVIKHPTVGTFTEDVLAVLDYISGNERIFSQEIGLIGLSIGGGASIAATGQDERVRAAVTVGAMSHPIKVMRGQFAEKGVPRFVGTLLFGYMRLRHGLDFEKIAPENYLPNTEAEIFLIHGENDETIPLEQANDLCAANPEKTRLWIVPQKGHSDCHYHPEFWEKVGAFLNENLPVEQG
jgi:uncharacterized protein